MNNPQDDNTPLNKDNFEAKVADDKKQAVQDQHEQDQDQTWQALTKDWQAQATPTTDINALIAHTRKRVRRAKYCFALNVFVTLLITLYFVVNCIQGELYGPLNIYLGVASLGSIIFIIFEWKIRSKVWRQYNESPEQAITTAIENAQVSMRYLQISRWSIVPVIPLMNWYIYTVMENRGEHDLTKYFVGNFLILIMSLVFDLLYRKRKKEYQAKLQLRNKT